MDNILQRRSQNSFKTNLTNMSTRRSKTVNGRVQGTGRFQCRFLPKIIHYSVQVRFYVCLPTHAWFYFELICHYFMHQRREAGDPKYAKGPLIDGDQNVFIVSTDPAHSLDDALNVKLSGDPFVLDDPLTEGRLTAVEVDADQVLDDFSKYV